MQRQFEFENWIKRLESRKDRALARCSTAEDRAAVYDRYRHDLKTLTDISRVDEWARSRKCKIVFDSSKTSGGVKNGNTLTISSRLSIQKQFYYILHEAGHVLVEHPFDSYMDRYAYGYVADSDENESKTTRHRIDIVAEELEAWHRGKKLARRLGIVVDNDEFERHRCDAMLTYFKWALRSGGYGGNRVSSKIDD